MKSNDSIRNEIAVFVNGIENHKALVAILKFVKIMYRNNIAIIKGVTLMKFDYSKMIEKMLAMVRKGKNSEKKLKMIYDYICFVYLKY